MNAPLARSILVLALTLAALASTQAQTARKDTGAAPLNPLGAIEPSSYQDFVERPLFSATRRKPKAPDAEEQAAVAVAPSIDLKLLGVITSPDGSIAQVSSGDGSTSQSLRQGESIEGWTVVAIETSNVTLSRDGETMALAIFNTDDTEADTGTEPSSDDAGIVFGTEDSADAPAPQVRVIESK
jgi:type II secretory pathway component PulC